MEKKKISKKKLILSILAVILVAIATIFTVFVSIYYKADDMAFEALNSTNTVKVSEEDDYFKFDGPGEDMAYIFYPGAKIGIESYAPILSKMADAGIDVYLVKMPFRLAIFGINKADSIIEDNTEYTSWYIGGHSMGGAMSASYASKNLDKLDGVILLGAYSTESLQKDGFKVLSIYGDKDIVLSMDKVEASRDFMPQDYYEIVIPGANHAQFGNYGIQEGDGEATITAEEQQNQTIDAVKEYIITE